MLLISDASVLIDVELAGLSQAMFQLVHEFAVPDVLFAEELRDQHEALLALGLQLRPMPATVIETSVRLRHRYAIRARTTCSPWRSPFMRSATC